MAESELQALYRYDVELPAKFRHGFGEIYFARDRLFDEDIALKVIPMSRLLGDQAEVALRAFRYEALVQARFGRECDHIVRVFDIGTVSGSLFYTMEVMAGGDASQLAGNITLASARGLIWQIADALSFAHSRGVVHSDVKPQNILTDRSYTTYKLADFGLLKVIESIAIASPSGSLLVGGTPYYLPASHRREPERINKATDVYGLALSFYELVAGTRLELDRTERPQIPGIIMVKHEQRAAPDNFRKLIAKYAEGWTEAMTIDDLRTDIQRLSV